MAKIRLQRVASLMKHILSKVVTQELKDPRCGFITITDVQISPDLKTARAGYSVLGSDAEKRTAGRALDSARGYIQSRVGDELQVKYTPVITFHLDESIERDLQMQRKIGKIRDADRRAAVAKTIHNHIAAGSIPQNIIDQIHHTADSDPFKKLLASTVLQLAAIDTTPRPDLTALAAAEHNILNLLQEKILAIFPEAEPEEIPIDPGIKDDNAYTTPTYATGPDGQPLSPEQTYAGRANLIAILPAAPTDAAPAAAPPVPPTAASPEAPTEAIPEPPPRLRLAINAHIDAAPPYLPPSQHDDLLTGAGVADSSGQIAAILGALTILRTLRDKFDVRLQHDLCLQFVIDRHSGGIGTLCLTLQNPFAFDGIVVCDPTGHQPLCAAPGTVAYTAQILAPAQHVPHIAARLAQELEVQSQSLLAESDTSIFPDNSALLECRPAEAVLTCIQHFLPPHKLDDVRARITDAALRVVIDYRKEFALKADAADIAISFTPPLRDAFAQEPDTALGVYAIESARRAGLDPAPPRGSNTTSDARFPATIFPKRHTLTFGPGTTGPADTAPQTINLHDIAVGAKILAFLVLETSGISR